MLFIDSHKYVIKSSTNRQVIEKFFSIMHSGQQYFIVEKFNLPEK